MVTIWIGKVFILVMLYHIMANPNGVSATYNPAFLAGGSVPTYENLTSEELAQFDIALKSFADLVAIQSDSTLSNIILSERNAYLFAASIAKQQFDGATFGGIIAQTGFNMQPIRAATLLTQGSTTPVYSWTKSFTSAGWQGLFGSQSAPLTLGTTGNATYVGTTYKRVMIVATHIIDNVPLPFDEIQIGVQKQLYPVMPVGITNISNVYLYKFPAPILVVLDGQFFVQANVQRLGTFNPRLLGLQFVTSEYAMIE